MTRGAIVGNVQWVACSAKTGVVITDLPDIVVGDIESVMMGYATTQATLPVAYRAGLSDAQKVAHSETLLEATEPGAVYLVLLEDSVPTWGALVARRQSNQGDSWTLALGTVETYFRRRFVGDLEYTNEDQCAIVEALATLYAADEIPLTVAAAASSRLRDRNYLDKLDKSLLSILSELAGVENGPEWAITWQTCDVDGQTAYCPVLVVADRLGSEPAPGLDPAITWDMPGSFATFEFSEDYSDGSGANDVMAVSSAAAEIRPQSEHVVTVDTRPKFEMRFTPSTSITQTETLNEHAERKSAQVANGTRTLQMTLKPGAAGIRPGIDYQLGDTIGFVIGGPGVFLPTFPHGMSGRGRVTSWKRAFNPPSVTPTLTELEIN